MISVQNHLPPLSGSKRFLVLGVALLIAACSPKVRPVTQAVKPTEKPVTIAKPAAKPIHQPQSSIAMLLPFGLDHLDAGSKFTNTSLTQANIALDYYQGFKLALDSLTALGYNYKLQVFDTKGLPSQSHALAYNPQVISADLIVGPIFPEDLKAFTSVFVGQRKPILSPLSPAAPATIDNQNLITATPPLEYHAAAAAKYVQTRLAPKKIFVLKSGYTEETEYITPFKTTIDTLSKGRTTLVQTTIVRGNLKALLPQLSPTATNVILMPSTNQAFLTITMRSLDSVAKRYPVVLIGHPSWEKFNFLKADLLQRLKTHITLADNINYKQAATTNFMRAYRKAYRTEAGEYAIKGFDEGMYFGRILGVNKGETKNLNYQDFKGMHNDFHFIKKPGLGYINTQVDVMEYYNYQLRKVE